MDEFNYRVWHYKNYHVTKTLIVFANYSLQVLENKKQLVNIDIEYLFSH